MSGDVFDGLLVIWELVDDELAGVVGPLGFVGGGVDLGDSSEQAGAEQGWAPDAGAEQGAAQWFADLVGVDQSGNAGGVAGAVCADDGIEPVG